MGIIEAGGTVRPVHTRPTISPTLQVKKLHPDAIIPTRAHATDAGLDLHALEEVTLSSVDKDPVVVRTGIATAIPVGAVGLVYIRSSLGFKHNITLANSVGVLDADYRGEIMVALHNSSNMPYTIKKGDRFAQLVITPALLISAQIVDELPETVRGKGGFGSTGV